MVKWNKSNFFDLTNGISGWCIRNCISPFNNNKEEIEIYIYDADYSIAWLSLLDLISCVFSNCKNLKYKWERFDKLTGFLNDTAFLWYFQMVCLPISNNTDNFYVIRIVDNEKFMLMLFLVQWWLHNWMAIIKYNSKTTIYLQ